MVMGKYDTMTKKEFKKAIRLQKNLIQKNNFEPTWELFSNTFGWFQMKKEMSVENQELYEKLWKNEV